MATPADHDYIVVLIDEVDIEKRMAWGIDKTNAKIPCSMTETIGGIWRIPNQGEFWTVERKGYIWYIDKKIDSSEEHTSAIDTLAPGDVRISGTNEDSNIFITGNIAHNGHPLETNLEAQTFNSDNPFTEVTLSQIPIGAVLVYLNGLLVDPSLWTITNKVITFTDPMGAGQVTVYA